MKLIGRNDSCPCNSGKKYKLCCQHKDELKKGILQQEKHCDSDWIKLRTAEGDIEESLSKYVKKGFGRSIHKSAWSQFGISDEFLLEREAYEVSFNIWMQHSWLIDSKFSLTEGVITIAQLCRREYPKLFTEYQEQILDAIQNSPFSFFIVQEVIPGQRLFLKDIILQKEVVVKENLGTQLVKKGDMLFCRPITVEDQSIIVGFFPYPVPNRFFDRIISYREKIIKSKKSKELTAKNLIDLDGALRELYFTIMKEAFLPINFSNTDGEAIILNEIFYDLKCRPCQLFSALSKQLPADYEISWEERVCDKKGVFVEIQIPWLKAEELDKKIIGGSTTLGNFTITPQELRVFVNSNERAIKAIEMIQDLLGNKVVFRDRKEIDMSTSQHLEDVDEKTLGPKPIEKTPEIDQTIKEYIAKYWINWLDTNIPILENLTPRKAVKSKLGREKLEALLLHFESTNKINRKEGDNYNQIDVEFLKEELGMV